MKRLWIAGVIVGLLAVVMADRAKSADKEKDKAPALAIVLGARQAAAIPCKACCARTGGGNIKVTQTEPDSVTFTMTGAAATSRLVPSAAQFTFNLEQCFDIVAADPKIDKVRVTLTGQVVGVLRSQSCCGCKQGGIAEICTPGEVCIQSSTSPVLHLHLPPRGTCCGESLSVNDREGPVQAVVAPGRYTLNQTFAILAGQPKLCSVGSSASADFSPGEVFKEEWLGKKEGFRGINKKDFGFQVLMHVEPAAE